MLSPSVEMGSQGEYRELDRKRVADRWTQAELYHILLVEAVTICPISRGEKIDSILHIYIYIFF